jgi:hypothetical protein
VRPLPGRTRALVQADRPRGVDVLGAAEGDDREHEEEAQHGPEHALSRLLGARIDKRRPGRPDQALEFWFSIEVADALST